MDEKRNYDPNAEDSMDLITYLRMMEKEKPGSTGGLCSNVVSRKTSAQVINDREKAEIERVFKAFTKMPRNHRINYLKASCGTPKPNAVQIKDNEGKIYWSAGYGESCHPSSYKLSADAKAELKKRVFAYQSFYEKHNRNVLFKLAAFIKWILLNIAIPATVFLTTLIMLWKVVF